jgi:two-component system copper resistance phosphate regulon response regulator CusR
VNRILIAEDEDRIAAFLDKGLAAEGYATTVVTDGASAYEYARTGQFDLLILDLGLPIRDGLTVLRQLRLDHIKVPVIILTARDAVPDRVAGLEGGADDYMAKPFAFAELLARVHLRLRTPGQAEPTVLTYGDLSLDLRTRYAHVGGHQVELTAREFSITETLLRHPNQVLSREQLLDQVWGLNFDPGSNVVDVYVRNLRRKLGPSRIETVRSMGYRLVEGSRTGRRA